MAIAPSITQAYDDVGPNTGAAYFGDYTNDTAPRLTVRLGDQWVAGDTLVLRDGGSSVASVTLTEADRASGQVQVDVSGLGDGWHTFRAAIVAPDGTQKALSSSDWALGVETDAPASPEITSVNDNVGERTGEVAEGGRTDDATLTFTFQQPGAPPIPQGSPGHAPYGGPAIQSGFIRVYDGATQVGQGMVSFGGQVTVTTSALAAGEHTLTAVAVDRAGNVSAATSFQVTIAADGEPVVTPPVEPTVTEPTPPVVTEPTPPTEPLPPAVPAPSAGSSAGQTMTGGDSGAALIGGEGDDTVSGGAGQDFLRGGEGDDRMVGGASFDDMHGNQGQDTLWGGLGDDWVVGGKDKDLLYGEDGADIVYGNIGADTCDGGAGDDLIRGGQDNDVLSGGAGRDWLSGDRGDDTVTGGAGADVFHTFGTAGVDWITDFNLAEGDRVMVDAGTTYAYAQVGFDTVVTMDGGGRLVLAGVQASTLGSDWIFAG